MQRRHHLPLLLTSIAAITLSACGGDDGYEKNQGSSSNIKNLNVLSASSDGASAHMEVEVSYKNTDYDQAFVEIGLIQPDNQIVEVSQEAAIKKGEGSILVPVDVTLNTEESREALTFKSWINNQTSKTVDNAVGVSKTYSESLIFPRDLSRALASITELRIAPVEGSYSNQLNSEIGSNDHFFSFNLYDQNGNSVPGLDEDPKQYFQIIENGQEADEESLDNAFSRQDSLDVYFVIDASNSIVIANAVGEVKEAVSRMVLSLANLSTFHYMQFATHIKTIGSVSELTYDEKDRFTALYQGIDETLTLVQNVSPEDKRRKVVVVLTDGKDNYSANGYDGQFTTPDEVKIYLLSRITEVSQLLSEDRGGLVVYTIGLGDGIDQTALEEIAQQGNGQFVLAENQEALGTSFSAIYNLIRSTYSFQYQSPVLRDDSSIVLRVTVNGVSAEHVLR